MHEERLRVGGARHLGVDLPISKRPLALLVSRLESHADPDKLFYKSAFSRAYCLGLTLPSAKPLTLTTAQRPCSSHTTSSRQSPEARIAEPSTDRSSGWEAPVDPLESDRRLARMPKATTSRGNPGTDNQIDRFGANRTVWRRPHDDLRDPNGGTCPRVGRKVED